MTSRCLPDRLLETYLASRRADSFIRQVDPRLGQAEAASAKHFGEAAKRTGARQHRSGQVTLYASSPFARGQRVLPSPRQRGRAGDGRQSRRRRPGRGKGAELTPDTEIKFPHSIGMLYSAYLGFTVNDGEYKVMGLHHGEPKYVNRIWTISRPERRRPRLDMRYFNYCTG